MYIKEINIELFFAHEITSWVGGDTASLNVNANNVVLPGSGNAVCIP